MKWTQAQEIPPRAFERDTLPDQLHDIDRLEDKCFIVSLHESLTRERLNAPRRQSAGNLINGGLIQFAAEGTGPHFRT